MLAHRLSQPLTTLRGSIEVALTGEMDESECRQVLELSLQESHRMAKALETLRDVIEMEEAHEQVQPVSWTQFVEKLLEEAASVNEDRCPRLVSEMKEVRVNANALCLGTATARLIAGAIRAARGNRLVRISLSAGGGTACLSVHVEVLSPDAEAGAGGTCPPEVPEESVLGELDQWIVRRAIERQGGELKVSQGSETCCYQLSLPLAKPEIANEVTPQ